MTRPRRAKARPSRVALVLLAAVVLVGGGGVLLTRLLTEPTSAAGPEPTSVVTRGRASTTSAKPTFDSTPTSAPTSPTAKPSATQEVDPARAERALTSCRKKVAAADRVLDRAASGVEDWADHVQAQTDANADEISVEQMDAIFTKTRLAGPKDQERYSDAKSDYDKTKGSCESVDGAARATAAKLKKCDRRHADQRSVLAAADDAMADWDDHLSAMRRSRMGGVDDAEGVWIRAWRAAPPHIEAYEKAADRYQDAPSC